MPKTIPYAMYSQPDETLKGFAEYFEKWIATPAGKAEFLRDLNHVREMRESIEADERRRMAV